MSDIKDDFLKDLQSQCLIDSKEYLDGFIEDLSDLTKNPEACFKRLAIHVHSLKGNVQAAGFLFLGNFLHEFESLLSEVEGNIKLGKVKLPQDELSVLEFLFSDFHFNLGQYIEELKKNDYNDKQDFFESRKKYIQGIHDWWKQHVVQKQNSGQSVTEINQKLQPSEESERQNILQLEVAEKKIAGAVEAVAGKNGSNRVKTEADEPQEKVAETLKSSNIEDGFDNGPRHFLLCKAGTRHYGVLVSHIVEIVSQIKSIPLPIARRDIKGLINLRGETVSVLSLETIFGSLESPKYLVICEHEGRSFGFEVDEAERVLMLSKEDLHDLPESNNRAKKRNITHVAHVEEKEVMILNVNELLAA